ncbi:ATP-binding protein [Gemmiger sp.]
MPQAEPKNSAVTARLDDLQNIFQQMVLVDRAHDEAELYAAVNELLHAMGDYTMAERAYIFEAATGPDVYDNTVEWCAPGITPQIDNLQKLHTSDMPVWCRTFGRGESIIIEDLESIRTTMPKEYEILKPQGIRTEIAFPILYRETLLGFLGLDNPDLSESQRFISILAVVGSHLGAAWQNSHMGTLLQQRQNDLNKKTRQLAQAIDEAETSSSVVSAISKIYASIYQIDLCKNAYEELDGDTKIYNPAGAHRDAPAMLRERFINKAAPEYRERALQFFDLTTLPERLREDETVAAEYLAVDGSWHLVRFIVQARDTDERVTDVLCVTRSISEQKRREEFWIVAAEEAARASAAKTEFLSRMAHDIRTPLNAVVGFTSLALRQCDDPEQVRTKLRNIETSAKYLDQIVSDILDLTRIDSGQMILKNRPQSITAVFHDLAAMTDGAHSDKQLTIRHSLHDITADRLLLDDLRFKQICMNLLSNAVKYTPDGGHVEFELYEKSCDTPNKIELVAVVRDDGIGMTPEYRKVMFSRFTRAVDTRVNKERGSGLGLSIVSQLTALMGGTIDVQSEPGQGSTFTVTLPLTCAQSEPAPQAAAAQPNDDCDGLHLLVAEDNDLNYEVISELLALYGITCERAENGAVCVEKFCGAPPHTYDAILMDMQMPVMDGPQAATTLRSVGSVECSRIPILAITANASEGDVRKCLDSGMNVHISKPVDITKLLTHLAALCRGT